MEKITEITEDMITKAAKEFFEDPFNAPLQICPKPTREFFAGEKCQVGNLRNCVVREILFDGKIIRVDYQRGLTRDHPIDHLCTKYWWWHDVEKPRPKGQIIESNITAPQVGGYPLMSAVSSLLFKMSHGGVVFNPNYQRDYVWDEHDEQALLDSIFNHVSIGQFILLSHKAYAFKGSKDITNYYNVDGTLVAIEKGHDYTEAIIDGQQRFTTLWKFYTDRICYRGFRFSELSPTDQSHFTNTSIAIRSFDFDEKYNELDVLKLFISVNKGVPQSEAHLAKVKRRLERLSNATVS